MNIDNLRIHRCDRSDININLKLVRVHALLDHLIADIELKLFPHERTGGPTKFVTDLRPGQFTAVAQKFPGHGHIDIFGESLYQRPALAETRTTFERHRISVWQSKDCPHHRRHPPVLLNDLCRNIRLYTHRPNEILLIPYRQVYELHIVFNSLIIQLGARRKSCVYSFSGILLTISLMAASSASVASPSPISLSAATTSCISLLLYSKLCALSLCLKRIPFLRPTLILRGVPLVMNTALAGTCVLKPKACMAYEPVGQISTPSRFAMANAIS